MNKKPNPIVGGREPGRNELCPCGSGLKYKYCHGDVVKRQLVQKFAAALMARLIQRTQMHKGLIPWPYICNQCSEGFTKPQMKERTILTIGISGGPQPQEGSFVAVCPRCGSSDIKKNEPPVSEVEQPNIIGGVHEDGILQDYEG